MGRATRKMMPNFFRLPRASRDRKNSEIGKVTPHPGDTREELFTFCRSYHFLLA
jgi:hypothetical protein